MFEITTGHSNYRLVMGREGRLFAGFLFISSVNSFLGFFCIARAQVSTSKLMYIPSPSIIRIQGDWPVQSGRDREDDFQ